jgi:hypothetical protein
VLTNSERLGHTAPAAATDREGGLAHRLAAVSSHSHHLPVAGVAAGPTRDMSDDGGCVAEERDAVVCGLGGPDGSASARASSDSPTRQDGDVSTTLTSPSSSRAPSTTRESESATPDDGDGDDGDNDNDTGAQQQQQARSSRGSGSAKKRAAASWKRNVTFNLANTYYTVIRDVIANLGYTVGKDTDKKCMVIW